MARSMLEELAWLKDNPAFEERPATIEEFLSEDYLGIERWVRKRIRQELIEIIGSEIDPNRISRYSEACVTGGIGIGKTTVASIVLPYLVHWVLCLKDPQAYFDLLPGSRIAFMQMSTSESQAKEVVFGDIKARINASRWFQSKYTPDPTFKNQLRFPKEIWVLPGDSAETTFEGYNILGGIIDEGDSHKVTKIKDYAEDGYATISSRITSRFQDRGFLLVIGQTKMNNGFMARKYLEFLGRPDAYAVRLAIWESMGEEFYQRRDGGKTFTYDVLRKTVLPAAAARIIGGKNLIEVPEMYRRNFEMNPEKALKDLAGIPPKVGNPFISLVDRIEACRDRWIDHYGDESPVGRDGRIARWFVARESLKRSAHIDLAYAADGDGCGIAMGHVRETVVIDGETKPLIVIDFAMRLQAMPGTEIFLGDVRHIIYNLRDERKFRLSKVTLDGFQSTDTLQQLAKRRFETDLLSIDKSLLPYSDVRDAIYEGRLEFPPYVCKVVKGERFEEVEIIVQELSELIDNGNKVDHPEQGSKDVSDAIAGVVTTLMGDRRYHRKVRDFSSYKEQRQAVAAGGSRSPVFSHPSITDPGIVSAPYPIAPRLPSWRS
jgi:hypothetical protein